MRMIIYKWFVLLFALRMFQFASEINSLQAGEFNEVLTIGDAAPAWEKLPGVDDREYALDDFKDKPLVVVVFTCNTCPYAIDYEERINELAKKHGGDEGQVAFIAIGCNAKEEDKLPAMKARTEARGFVFPYVYDESQQAAKDYGASRTPEFFLLDRERRVIYMGSLDDASKLDKVAKTYLADAIAAALDGKEIAVKETPPIGCAIRWARRPR